MKKKLLSKYPDRPFISFFPLIKKSLYVYINKFPILISITIVSKIIQLFILFLIFGVLLLEIFGLFPSFNKGNTILAIIAIFLLLILFFILIFLFIWEKAAIIYAIVNQSFDILEILKKSLANVFDLGWISFIVYGFLIGAFFFLLFPGIIFYVWFLFSNFLLFTDKKKGFKALSYSRALVVGRWWQVFMRIIFLLFIEYFLILFPFFLKDIIDIKFIFIYSIVILILFFPFYLIFIFNLLDDAKRTRNQILIRKFKTETKLISKIVILGYLFFIILFFYFILKLLNQYL